LIEIRSRSINDNIIIIKFNMNVMVWLGIIETK
jgi:hypothetical protein